MVLLASGIVDEDPSGAGRVRQYCPRRQLVGVEPRAGSGIGWVFGTLLGFEESHSSSPWGE
jgi:hypothetical protein